MQLADEHPLVVRNDGSLRLRPKLTESYQRVNCALGELRKRGMISNLPKAYVGSERYDRKLN
jgi:hypothetical protein